MDRPSCASYGPLSNVTSSMLTLHALGPAMLSVRVPTMTLGACAVPGAPGGYFMGSRRANLRVWVDSLDGVDTGVIATGAARHLRCPARTT